MSGPFIVRKDPDADLDYAFDWSDWLPDGDTISASTWTVPDGLASDAEGISDTKTSVWLQSGTSGESYEVVNHITTSEGREDDRTLLVFVEHR